MFWIAPRREHRRWARHTEQAQQWLGRNAAWLGEAVPRVSSWTPVQHLHHVASVNQHILDRLAAEEDGMPGDPTGRPNIAGYLVLTLGRLPRGRGQSPDAFRPPDSVDRPALADRVEAHREQLDALAGRLDVLKQSNHRFPHPLLGDFDASEWLRFARIHTAHHHRIIRDIMAEQR